MRDNKSGLRMVAEDEAGAGLVEVLVAVAILVSTLVIFVTALSTEAFAVRRANQLTTATNLAAGQLESIKATGYVTGTAVYPAIPSGAYTIVQAIRYWNGISFVPDPTADAGMQEITVTVFYNSQPLITITNYKVNR